MKSLNIDIIFPWEVGLIIVILGIITIIIGIKQSKQKPFDDLDKLPLTKPATKIFFWYSCFNFWIYSITSYLEIN